MRNFLTGILFLFLELPVMHAQYELRGFVKDADTREVLAGAEIKILGHAKGTVTDMEGKFVLKSILSSPVRIQVSMLGYKSVTRIVNFDKPVKTIEIF
jgi:iron complex outermembrane receptor protein